jgi:succinate dehydrogenase / fumarate reductase iron-sulfur subunit
VRIILEIRRFNPEKGGSPAWQKFELEALPNDRLLDTLLHVSRVLDPTLGLRKSCGHGICGSDAMVINGRERLACKTLVKEVAETDGAVVRIEPLRTMPVEKDLMVDQRPFFAHYRNIKP